jgi:hypothetical protein
VCIIKKQQQLYFQKILPQGKIIEAQRRPYGYGCPYDKKKFLISEYDKIVFYLQVEYQYAELLEDDYIAVFTEYENHNWSKVITK